MSLLPTASRGGTRNQNLAIRLLPSYSLRVYLHAITQRVQNYTLLFPNGFMRPTRGDQPLFLASDFPKSPGRLINCLPTLWVMWMIAAFNCQLTRQMDKSRGYVLSLNPLNLIKSPIIPIDKGF